MVLDVASKVPGAPAGVGSPGPPLAGSLRGAPCRPGPSSAKAGPGSESAGPGKKAERYGPGGHCPAATWMASFSPQLPCSGDGGGFRTESDHRRAIVLITAVRIWTLQLAPVPLT